MKNLTLRQLRTFVTVARTSSFARAAHELHLTPPAVSMQIRELETVIGLPLFERAGRKTELTLTAEYFLVYARRVLATIKEAEDSLTRLRGLKGGRVTLGMVSTAKYFLPRLLAAFRAEHPGIDFRLEVGNRNQLVQQLHSHEVDLAVMGRPPKELATRAEPFAAHPHAIVAAADHPLAQASAIAPERLQREEFIVREPGSGTRALMEQFFKQHHIEPAVLMEMNSNETIKQAVIAGMGIAFMSLHTVSLELEVGQLKLLDVDGLPAVRRWHIVNMQGKHLSPAAEAFRYFVLEQGESMLARQFAVIAPVAVPVTKQTAAKQTAAKSRNGAGGKKRVPPKRRTSAKA